MAEHNAAPAAYAKPLPRITPDNRPFWEAARRHELHLPHCADCARAFWPPGPVCPWCFEENLSWRALSGRGVISSWVLFHRAWFPSFAGDIPYAVVQVELEEGPRLTSGTLNLPHDRLAVGLPVEVAFDDVTPAITLPKFRARRN
ncbi:MAG: OB-fold domain-containing protein [Candidatus Lambdaproteobacteria bacterium]|nr:OB-fold domain-containing protein [Candidatus Lambdaproteobacteria bacterium]